MSIIRISILCLFTLSSLISCKKTKPTVSDVVPISPSELTVTLVSNTQATLNWIDKSTNESGFKVERKTGNGTFGVIATTASDITTINDAGLTPNTTYTYRVYSFNSTGKSISYTNEVTITTYTPPTVTTTAISDTTGVSAVSGGNITSDGGSPITARGIVWGTNPVPTIALATKTTDGSGVGQFASNLAGLTKITKYYVRAYATNAAGTAYGNELVFTSTTVDLNSGLVAYYPFNGNANDESGNNKNATVLNGVSISTGRNGQSNSSYLFNGINGLNSGISVPISLPASDYSMSIWFQINDTIKLGQNSSQTIVCVDPYTLFGVAFNHPYAPTKMMSCLGNGNGWLICADKNPNSWELANKLQWHNLIILKSTTSYKYYIDGNLFRTQEITPNYNIPVTKVYLGSYPIASGEVLNGKLDDVRFYNRIITQDEITYLSRN
jgi:hypothetical protein